MSAANNLPPIAWLLLSDDHAVPIHGLAPDDLKDACKRAMFAPEAELKHRVGLTAIVHSLGVDGDFGDYKNKTWPDLQRFLQAHGCRERESLFVDDIRAASLGFGTAGPRRRQLADRVYLGPAPAPRRVFLGYGVDWDWWDDQAFRTSPYPLPNDHAFVATTREEAVAYVLRHHIDYFGQWGFVDDKLVAGSALPVVDKTYWAGKDAAAKRLAHAPQLAANVRMFRRVFDEVQAGWVDLLPYNRRLTVLRAHDGAWDLIWRDLRESPPPRARPDDEVYGLDSSDRPAWVRDAQDVSVHLYFRRDRWDERDGHDAEQTFYDRGADAKSRQLTTSDEVRRLYLTEIGAMPTRRRSAQAATPGFQAVEVDGRQLLVGPLVTIGEFRRMLAETHYLERRNPRDEDWHRGNVGAVSEPVTLSWKDAQAYCAWLERQLGVLVRLLTKAEHRALRPFHSPRYAQMAGGDFWWENAPPRPLVAATDTQPAIEVPRAVVWSEPRFDPPEPAAADDPKIPGYTTQSRRRWLTDFPPRGDWLPVLPWGVHACLRTIDAWDAYEWCHEYGWMAGRFWEGQIGAGSWGAYKNVKVGCRMVLDLDPAPQ